MKRPETVICILPILCMLLGISGKCT